LSNKRKKSRRSSGARSSGYRAPKTAAPVEPVRRGLLDSIFAPRAREPSPAPRIGASLLRGISTVLAAPVVLIAVPLALAGEWLALIALGYQGPFSTLSSALALPPIGTIIDGNISATVFGLAGGQFAILAFMAVRALLLAAFAAVLVEMLEIGRVTPAVGVRALRAVPVALLVNVAGLALLIIAGYLGVLLGPGLALLLQMAALVGGVYLFAAAPVIAAAEGRSAPDSIARSVRSARMPGSGSLTLAALYAVPALAFAFVPKPGTEIGVNPSPAAWTFAIVANLLHVAMLGAFAYRYLAISDVVPDAPARQRRQSSGR
jgi:hypothetical protein